MIDKRLFSATSLAIVGNLNRDVSLRGLPVSPRLFKDGETSVESIVETIGGGGANSACAAAALGARVRFLGKVGADALGQRLRQVMEAHGVQTSLVSDPNCRTGTTVALGWKNGQRHFLSCLPNNQRLNFEDLHLSALKGCAHLLRADVWFSESMLEEGNQRLFLEARRRGMITSLDINFDPCWSGGAQAQIARRKRLLRQSLGAVDIAHGNVRELCLFTGSPNLETALRRLGDCGVKAAVIHLGNKGAGYWADGHLLVEPPCFARRVVHSTGTGDILSVCMVLLHAQKELTIREKLRLSNRVARDFIEDRLPMIPTL